ncbi:hypothetical protein B7463_g301, partial [Scytalidium lignicola]
MNTATTMAYPSLPASPTLTNPDMILPYDGYDSPPDSPPQLSLESTSAGWNGAMTQDMSYSLGTGQIGPVTPMTPIIYGNGTMLSDIGEVTETESTVSRLPKPAERRAMRAQVSHLRDSSGPTAKGIAKRQRPREHERKMSIESTSTVTSAPNPDVFADFDDGVSVDDSVFQGDDEESVADSYSEQIVASETERLSNHQRNTREDDGESSVALSRRAEQILLNAKRRLNNMEGNLSRARSSLYTIPSPSMSSIHSSSPLSRTTPSPPQPDSRISPQPDVSSANNLQHTTPSSPKSASGHSRVHSENAIPTDVQATPYVRSASAAGYLGSSGNNIKQDVSKSLENIRASSVVSPSTKPSPPRLVPLEPLSEDDLVQEFDRTGASSRSGYEDGYLSPASEYRDTSRSSSSLQMRDLQNQMQDLKGRLSVLRDKARDDSMRRRSMQSLRTPSPFTVAEHWHTEAPSYANGDSSADAGVEQPAWSGEDPNQRQPEEPKDVEEHTRNADGPKHIPRYGGSDAGSVYEDVHENQPVESTNSRQVNGEHNTPTEDVVNHQGTYDTAAEQEPREVGGDAGTEYNEESVNGEEEDGYESESGDSTYHDAIQEQISHEDREDAFDYEHFFLHSAMGTISQQTFRRRDSVGSYSSDTSVETARGPVAYTKPKDENGDERTARGHVRGGSKESISTLATFATATEGRASAIGHDVERENYAVQNVVANAVSRRSSASLTPKQAVFDPLIHGSGVSGRASAPPGDWNSTRMHRPSMASIDSFGSSGTTRSFPLVNKAKSQGNLKGGGGLNGDFRSDPMVAGKLFASEDREPSPVSMLAKEDQILVERIVASLGKCVLGLQDAGRASTEGRAWRRRLDAARQVLEGHEGAMP